MMVSCTVISPLEHYQTPNCIARCSSIEGVDRRKKLKWVNIQVGYQHIDVKRLTIDMHLNELSHKIDRAFIDNSLINTLSLRSLLLSLSQKSQQIL